MTLRDLERLTDHEITNSNLSELERGLRSWLPHQIESVADALDVDPIELLRKPDVRQNPDRTNPVQPNGRELADAVDSDDMIALNVTIGNTVRALREHRGMTLREFEAATSGRLAYSHLSALERGKRTWLPHQIESAADALGVDPSDLLRRPDVRQNPDRTNDKELGDAVDRGDIVALARAILMRTAHQKD